MRFVITKLSRLLICGLLYLGATLQVLAISTNDLLFERIDLPYDAHVVNCLYQDAQGMMWMSNSQGIFSYNGYSVRRVIEGNIHAMVGYGNDSICFADDKGLYFFDLKTEQSREVFNGHKIEGDIRVLFVHRGILYVGTRFNGIFLLNLHDKSLSHFDLFEGEKGFIFDIEPCGDDVYIGHYKGLSRLTSDGRLIDCGVEEPVYVVRYDETDGVLWIGTERSLLKREPKNGNTYQVMTGSTINEIEFSMSGDLLLASEHGLRVYNKNTGSVIDIGHDVTDIRHSIPNNNVHYILRDKQQNIWVATDRGVVIFQAYNQFKLYDLSDLFPTHEGNFFNHVLIDSRGDRWLGGDNGLVLLSDRGNRWFHTGSGLRKNVIRSIYEDRDHEIWITSDAGIARFDQSKNNFEYYLLTDKKGRNANWAYDLCEDVHRRLWVATYMGGLFVVDKDALLKSGGHYVMENLPFNGYEDILNTTSRLCQMSDSLMWVNTDKGLALINIETFKVDLKEGISAERMKVMNGNLWMSYKGKLYRYDAGQNKLVASDAKLQDGMIYDFLYEKDHMWLSTSSGVYFTDKNVSSLYSYGKPTHPFIVGGYDEKHSEVLWAGEDFISVQSLRAPLVDSKKHQVYITSITVQGNRLDRLVPRYANEILLPSQEDIRIELSSFSFIPQRPASFWYRLGKDGEWHMLPYGSNQITLAHLSCGTYTLYLSCDDPRGSSHYTSYTLRVPYPWYLQWWAWGVYLVATLLVFVLVWRYLKRRERISLEQREREQTLALTQQKIDFFVNMSHELKTPLSLIITPLSKLVSETSNARTKERLKGIYANSLRLNEIIYRILDVKRMEAEGEDTLLISHVELCELLQRCINEFDDTVSSKGIAIHFTSNEETLWMDLDAIKIQASVRNLLSNAVKYSPKDSGVVEVLMEVKQDTVTISVHDNGDGVEPDELPKLFHRYFQGRNALEGSSGIGLSLVKKYVEMHGGFVKAENDNGLKVTFGLPMIVSDVIEETVEDGVVKEKPRLLLVDDNKEILDFLTSALSANYTCDTAKDGEEALKMLDVQVPDLIITDQMMPGMDGTTLCKRIRHEHATSIVPIIMLTAKDDSETELESLRIGVDVFMPKPFDLRKLQLHVVQLLNKRQAISQSVNISQIAKGVQVVEDESLTSDEALMNAIMRIVGENMMNEGFNVTLLAEMLHLNQKQLYRKLKQLTGKTPVEFIRQKRLQKAASLLEQKCFTVSEVMYKVGFSNPSYFSKCFQKEFGVLPREFQEGQDHS